MVLTTEQLSLIEKRKIKRARLTNGEIARIFIATNGLLCQFKKRSSKYGSYLSQTEIESLIEEKSPKSEDELNFKMITKFRKEALKATFTNELIRKCLALPDTFEKWVAEGKKSPYQYGVTTGCGITGKLISVEYVAKKSYLQHSILEAVKNKTSLSTTCFRLDGYDGSVSFEKKENNDFVGYLSKEYKGCGNGYYYLLINDDYFIGYDID